MGDGHRWWLFELPQDAHDRYAVRSEQAAAELAFSIAIRLDNHPDAVSKELDLRVLKLDSRDRVG
ncbi:hypothetical protein [Bradyrhizobium sp. Tv2a-2]|uniref:hypothetical protein n=1 Tax=Bradyrhizobium sp. Tv2a-2 TaxID=113395 RepID=UPI0012ECB186|nr:hypothetical protein [Bradyrhizobium sp. Tv2a-2]